MQIRNLSLDPASRQQRRIAGLEQAQVRNQQVKTNPKVGGLISAAGAILGGGGFTVTHAVTGVYTITFTVAMSSAPTAHATPAINQPATTAQAGASTTVCTVQTISAAGALVDASFNFTVELL